MNQPPSPLAPRTEEELQAKMQRVKNLAPDAATKRPQENRALCGTPLGVVPVAAILIIADEDSEQHDEKIGELVKTDLPAVVNAAHQVSHQIAHVPVPPDAALPRNAANAVTDLIKNALHAGAILSLIHI